MTTYTDCRAAAKQPWHGFHASCEGCTARSVSRGPHFARVRKAGVLDAEYRRLLDMAGVSHQQVKDAAAADVEQAGC